MSSELQRRLSLLARRERARWLVLVPLALLIAALEAVGGAAVYALLAVLSDPAGAPQRPFVSALTAALPAARAGVLGLALLAAVVHVAKSALIVGVRFLRARLLADAGSAFSERLLAAYLRAPWVFHLRRNSAELTRNVTEGVAALFAMLDAATTLLTEALVVAGLIGLSVLVSPLATLLAAGVIVAILALFMTRTQRIHARWGARRLAAASARLRHVQDALGGLKEVKVLGREARFAAAFAGEQRLAHQLDARHEALGDVPRVLVEVAFGVAAVALVILGSLREQSLVDVLPVVGVYGYTAFRVMPAFHRIALQLHTIRWSLEITRPLAADVVGLGGLEAPPPAPTPALALRETLAVDRVTFAYEGGAKPVLLDVSLTIRRGESVALVGATGAGKSTLADLLLGLLEPQRGRILVDGRPVGGNAAGWRRSVGYVPQAPYLLDDTLRRNIALGLADDAIDEAAVQRAVAIAQLEGFVASLPDGLGTVVGERGVRLSGGERQRVAIARALYEDPELLVLDEATSALDPATERELARAVDGLRGKKTLVIIAHRMGTLERCDRLLLLTDGRVAAEGPYRELVESSRAFRELAGLAPGAATSEAAR